MTLSLPEPISIFFSVSNGADAAVLTQCFSKDAVVTDEGKSYHGQEAIVAWIRGVRSKFDYSVEPTSISLEGDRTTVTSTVTGDFSGSPVRLDYVFKLQHDKIKSLEIH